MKWNILCRVFNFLCSWEPRIIIKNCFILKSLWEFDRICLRKFSLTLTISHQLNLIYSLHSIKSWTTSNGLPLYRQNVKTNINVILFKFHLQFVQCPQACPKLFLLGRISPQPSECCKVSTLLLESINATVCQILLYHIQNLAHITQNKWESSGFISPYLIVLWVNLEFCRITLISP